LPWALRTRIHETAIIDSTGVFWMEFLRRRREFIAGLGAAGVWPLVAQAEQITRPRIGVLRPIGSAPHESVEELKAGLKELGYVDGRNIALEIRYADGNFNRLSALATELVRLNVAVIVTYGPHGTRAASEATRTIPIVMGRMDDADGYGFVTSLARPGGNITGLSFQSAELSTKWLELMKDVLPRNARIAVLWDEGSTAHQLKTIQDAAHSIGVDLYKLTVRSPENFATAFTRARERQATGLVILASPLFTTQMRSLADLAITHRLPAIYMYRAFAETGGLISYGPLATDPSFSYRRAAVFVDKLLKGAKADELPVEQPTKFEFVINLKTAKALGVTIPATMIGRADEVIE
jgi:putative tryptophan/tyrosine transport system substrate-binding protein